MFNDYHLPFFFGSSSIPLVKVLCKMPHTTPFTGKDRCTDTTFKEAQQWRNHAKLMWQTRKPVFIQIMQCLFIDFEWLSAVIVPFIMFVSKLNTKWLIFVFDCVQRVFRSEKYYCYNKNSTFLLNNFEKFNLILCKRHSSRRGKKMANILRWNQAKKTFPSELSWTVPVSNGNHDWVLLRRLIDSAKCTRKLIAYFSIENLSTENFLFRKNTHTQPSIATTKKKQIFSSFPRTFRQRFTHSIYSCYETIKSHRQWARNSFANEIHRSRNPNAKDAEHIVRHQTFRY